MKSFEALEAELERAWSHDKSLRILQQMVAQDALRSVGVLSQLLLHGEPELRLSALELLIEISLNLDAGIQDLFFLILQDPLCWELRAPILKALLYRMPHGPASRERLLQLLQSKDWDLVAHIVQAIGPLADPELQAWLADCLKHPHYFVRKKAVEALGAQPWSQEVENYLLEMLSDAQTEVVLKVLQTLSNTASYRVMLQLKDLLVLPQTPSELKPALLDAAENIGQQLEALLQKDPAQLVASELMALAVWLCDETDEARAALVETSLSRGLNQIYRFVRADQIHLIQRLLEIPPEKGKSIYLLALRWGLKLNCLELPESAPLELRALLESLLLEQAGADTPPSEQEQAYQLLARYGGLGALDALPEFLEASSVLFLQILPLLNRNGDVVCQRLQHLSLREMSPQAQENSLYFLEGFQNTGGLPIALRLLKQSSSALLRQRLLQYLLNFGNLMLPFLLQELQRSQDPLFVREGLELLLRLEPYEESLSWLIQILMRAERGDQLRAALALRRLKGGAENLWRWVCEDISAETRELILEILRERGLRILPEILQFHVPEEFIEDWQALFAHLVNQQTLSAQELGALLKQAASENLRLVLVLWNISSASHWAECLTQFLEDPEHGLQIEDLLVAWGSASLKAVLNWALISPQREPKTLSLLVRYEAQDLRLALHEIQHVQARVLLIQALLKKGCVEGQDELWQLLPLSPHPLQLALLKSLSSFGKDLRWQPLLPMLEESHPELRREALRILAKTRASEVISAVMACLQDSDTGVVYAAIEALGDLKATQAFTLLSQLLQSAEAESNSELRAICLMALGKLQLDSVFPLLLKRLNLSEPTDQHFPVLQALAEFKTPEAFQRLIEYFESIQDSQQKIKTLEILGTSREPQAINYLLDHLQEWPLAWQRIALVQLARTGERWILATLEKLIHSGLPWPLLRSVIEVLDYFPRIEALRLLKQLQSQEQSPSLKGWILKQAIRDTLARLRERTVSET